MFNLTKKKKKKKKKKRKEENLNTWLEMLAEKNAFHLIQFPFLPRQGGIINNQKHLV